jgi:hypothetical protein
MVNEYDEYNVQQGIKNGQAWIGKKNPSEELVRDKYNPMLRYSKDENGERNDQYPPSIRFRLYKGDDGKYSGLKCYDNSKNEVEIDKAVQKGCRVKVLYHQQSCWINKNTGYGASNKLMQIKVFPSTKLTGYAFIGDESDEEDGENETTENLDEEEDQEEEVTNDLDAGVNEPEPELVAEKPKKGGRKKKATAE